MDLAPSITRYLVVFFTTMFGIIFLVWAYVASFPIAFMESGYASWTAKNTLLHECRLGEIAFFRRFTARGRHRAGRLPGPVRQFRPGRRRRH